MTLDWVMNANGELVRPEEAEQADAAPKVSVMTADGDVPGIEKVLAPPPTTGRVNVLTASGDLIPAAIGAPDPAMRVSQQSPSADLDLGMSTGDVPKIDDLESAAAPPPLPKKPLTGNIPIPSATTEPKASGSYDLMSAALEELASADIDRELPPVVTPPVVSRAESVPAQLDPASISSDLELEPPPPPATDEDTARDLAVLDVAPTSDLAIPAAQTTKDSPDFAIPAAQTIPDSKPDPEEIWEELPRSRLGHQSGSLLDMLAPADSAPQLPSHPLTPEPVSAFSPEADPDDADTLDAMQEESELMLDGIVTEPEREPPKPSTSDRFPIAAPAADSDWKSHVPGSVPAWEAPAVPSPPIPAVPPIPPAPPSTVDKSDIMFGEGFVAGTNDLPPVDHAADLTLEAPAPSGPALSTASAWEAELPPAPAPTEEPLLLFEDPITAPTATTNGDFEIIGEEVLDSVQTAAEAPPILGSEFLTPVQPTQPPITDDALAADLEIGQEPPPLQPPPVKLPPFTAPEPDASAAQASAAPGELVPPAIFGIPPTRDATGNIVPPAAPEDEVFAADASEDLDAAPAESRQAALEAELAQISGDEALELESPRVVSGKPLSPPPVKRTSPSVVPVGSSPPPARKAFPRRISSLRARPIREVDRRPNAPAGDSSDL